MERFYNTRRGCTHALATRLLAYTVSTPTGPTYLQTDQQIQQQTYNHQPFLFPSSFLFTRQMGQNEKYLSKNSSNQKLLWMSLLQPSKMYTKFHILRWTAALVGLVFWADPFSVPCYWQMTRKHSILPLQYIMFSYWIDQRPGCKLSKSLRYFIILYPLNLGSRKFYFTAKWCTGTTNQLLLVTVLPICFCPRLDRWRNFLDAGFLPQYPFDLHHKLRTNFHSRFVPPTRASVLWRHVLVSSGRVRHPLDSKKPFVRVLKSKPPKIANGFGDFG